MTGAAWNDHVGVAPEAAQGGEVEVVAVQVRDQYGVGRVNGPRAESVPAHERAEPVAQEWVCQQTRPALTDLHRGMADEANLVDRQVPLPFEGWLRGATPPRPSAPARGDESTSSLPPPAGSRSRMLVSP